MARGFISANSARVFALFFCCAREKGNYVEILLPAVTAGGGVAIGADRARTTRRKLSGKHDERNEGEHEQRESKGGVRRERNEGRSTFEGNSIRFAKSYVYFLGLVSSTEKKKGEGEGKESYRKLTLLRMLSTVALWTPPRSLVAPMGHCS